MPIPELPLLQVIRDVCRPEPGQVLLVGGAVRDLLLDRHPHDVDLLVTLPDHRFRQMVTALAQRLHRHVIRPAGFPHVVRLASRSGTLDLTRIAPGQIETNLRNRELTINAMALDIVTGTLHDPTGGALDLANHRLRAPSATVFSTDPVRVLRLFRFQAELGFQVDTITGEWARTASQDLAACAGERIQDELFRILANDHAARILTGIMDPVLTGLFPSLAAIRHVPQNGYHHLGVFAHTQEVVQHTFRLDALCTMIGCPTRPFNREDRIVLRLAALFHDTGKADTMGQNPDGRITFKGHQRVSVDHFNRDVRILKPATRLVERVSMLIDRHMMFLNFMLNGYSPHSFRKLIHLMGEDSTLLTLLAVADKLAARGPLATGSIEQICTLARAFFDCWSLEGNRIIHLPKLVDGHDVMALLSLKPSPQVGAILSAIRDHQLHHPDMTRQDALDLIRNWPRQPAP